MEHIFVNQCTEESKVSETVDATHKVIIDQYKQFFDVDQNKEVIHMAMDNCASILVKM